MTRTPVEIGQAFHKADSPLLVWTVNSFNESTEPIPAHKARRPDDAHHRFGRRAVRSTALDGRRSIAAQRGNFGDAPTVTR